MKKNLSHLCLFIAGALLAGCAANGNAQTPQSTQTSLQADTLQLAVGTAQIASLTTGPVTGLDVVATFRQPNGNSAVLVDTPTITGPAGFAVPATGPATDAGTSHISGAPQNLNPATQVLGTTFAQSGGVFSFGFGPFNSNVNGTAFYPGNPASYPMPFYPPSGQGAANLLRYIGGPPAYPFFNDGTFPTAFAGYLQGFTTFDTPPVVGTYTLSVAVVPGNAAAQTFTATANLSNTTPLPTLPAPTFTSDGTGGGSGTITVPADARIVETMVYILDRVSGNFYTVGPLRGTGALAYTLPDRLGSCTSPGCQNSPATSQPSLAPGTTGIGSGDTIRVYAVSYDWPMFEASPPGNTSATPTITGGATSNNQADVSTSPSLSSAE